MGSFSDYAEGAILNHLTTNSAYTPAATLYLALCTADPTDAGTGASMNECANSGSYARTAIAFGAAATRRVTQNANVVFPQATGAWGTVTHWAIVTSGTYGAGNMLAYGAFSSSFAVVSGNVWTVASGQVYVEISASNGITNYASNGFLDRMFRNQAFTISANYFSLHTTTNSDSTPGMEVSGGSYARTVINANGGAAPAWGAVSSSSVSNGAQVDFPAPTGSWGTVVHGGLYDASTAGNQLLYFDVTDQAISTETTAVNIQSGAFTMTMA